ncbi:VPA1262 family protein [Methylomagnum ishizawai]|uniref:VPA1262 family protein n=1 Tax=Methylomagnum ishizawai TaxID=1760988 RepID=UPI001C32A382|nr:VPA1262 family protein [Methylomagnum ishizawai]BBL75429.1 hypothetical protein MishRS11D_25270 [Methylomagnum ishizawai]
MAFSLNDLVNDSRLERLFSKHELSCALQLWILQIKANGAIENRLIYGRLLPYNYSDNTWHATDDDNFKPIEGYLAQAIRLNLYINSSNTVNLINFLINNYDLTYISQMLGLKIKPKLADRVGATRIASPLVYRPTTYLPNRDSSNRSTLLSPHGSAGALSASVSQVNKPALFCIDGEFSQALTAFIVEELNSDTGMDFGQKDLSRMGDLEFLVFPTLDDNEQELLNVCREGGIFTVKLNPIRIPHYNAFHVRLCITNDSQVIYSSIATVNHLKEDKINCEFKIPGQIAEISDGIEVEIYGFEIDNICTSTLCCKWSNTFWREVLINVQSGNNSGGSVQMDWLERVTKSTASLERLKAAQTINQGNPVFSSRAGGRKTDLWVPINREIKTLFAKLYPPRSEGRFFERLNDGNDQGRLEFVEWIKDQLVRHQNHQVLIFDPYFEDAGIGLIVPNAGAQSDYIVFTTLPKSPKNESWYNSLFLTLKSFFLLETPPINKDRRNRINNLLAACKQLKPLLKKVRLRVYGLKNGALHDRYFIIIGKDGLPVSGFNWSNSIQKANENYPLLITPIPADVLLKVCKYASELVRRASDELSDDPKDLKISLIFDSEQTRESARRYFEPLGFLKKPLAGRVLAEWTGERSLKGLKDEALKQRMRELGLLNKESLFLKDSPGLKGCIDQQPNDFENFKAKWDVIGEVLANTPAGDMLDIAELSSETVFLDSLAGFLCESFSRIHTEEVDAPITHIATSYFQETFDNLLTKPDSSHNFLHPVKYAVLTWAEYFAVKILWLYSPNTLLFLTENCVVTLSEEPQQKDAVKLSLLSQIINEIALTIEYGIRDAQRDYLILNANGFLKWMGLNALKSQLKKPDDVHNIVGYLSRFSYREKIQFLGWMINNLANPSDKIDIYRSLIDSLHQTLPQQLNSTDTNLLVDSLRGHMGQLGYCEPWLVQDVISPLLEQSRVSIDDLCEIWFKDMTAYFKESLNSHVSIFNRDREGRVTKTTAYFLAHSGIKKQETILKFLRNIFSTARRTVQQPLASTQNWAKWDSSFFVIIWILGFLKWASYFVIRPSMIEAEIESFATEAYNIVPTRPLTERKSNPSIAELIFFIEELDEEKSK